MVDTITPEERRTWRNEHASWTGRDSDLVVRVRLMDALESAEVSKAEAEAENARLRAERDWLAEKLADISDKVNKDRALPFCAACNICPVGDDEMEGRTCAVAIAEAAHQATQENE